MQIIVIDGEATVNRGLFSLILLTARQILVLKVYGFQNARLKASKGEKAPGPDKSRCAHLVKSTLVANPLPLFAFGSIFLSLRAGCYASRALKVGVFRSSQRDGITLHDSHLVQG